MKRKILKCLIVGSLFFVSAFSINAFASLTVEDYKQMEIEGDEPTYNQIMQDQTSYENWVSYIDSKTDSHYNMPSFSDVAILTENLLAYSVGNYADVASGVFDNLVGTFSLGSDIWDFMTFNVQRMAFDFLPDFVNILKSGVDEEIYTTTGGMWYRSAIFPASNKRVLQVTSGDGYLGFVNKGNATYDVIFVSVEQGSVASFTFYKTDGITVLATYYATTNSSYSGTKTDGYYTIPNNGSRWNMPANSDYLAFSSDADALADFFGDSPSMGGISLNGGVIVNDNPVINPVSLTSALGYPFKQTVINNYNNNTPMPWKPINYNYVDYNYSYDVPFWEGQELETIAYPDEIEFPSLEFEPIEVDENVDNAIETLEGSWIVEFLLIAILLLIVGLIL